MSNNHAAAPPSYRRHDFVETPEGLIFAVVDGGVECGRVLCFLRYLRDGMRLTKLDTAAAGALLNSRHAKYIFHSRLRDVTLHGVPIDRVAIHHRANERAAVLAVGKGTSSIARRCAGLIHELTQRGVSLSSIGVTGSLLIGAESDESDIDLVIYGREMFHRARSALKAGCGDGTFSALADDQWREAHRRRGCALRFDDFVWHERRKHNKAVIQSTKFDISCGECPAQARVPVERAKKLRPATIIAAITDDRDAFAFPARWRVDNTGVTEILAFTPTYTGQVFTGEQVEASGIIEQLAGGDRRLVIGSDREAAGQWIKVVG